VAWMSSMKNNRQVVGAVVQTTQNVYVALQLAATLPTTVTTGDKVQFQAYDGV